jgi:hypothetical protein
MLSIRLWRWYINITITILDIIHHPVFYLKHDFSETELFLRLQVEQAQLGPLGRVSPDWTQAIPSIEPNWVRQDDG